MRKLGISGGPHTGKSTLLEALPDRYPNDHFIPEQATRIIAAEQQRQEADPSYDPMVPWVVKHQRAFNLAVADGYVEEESKIPDNVDLSFSDRILYDSVFYCGWDNCHDLVPVMKRRAQVAGYYAVIFCEPVGTYALNGVRHEDETEALTKHDGLRQVYIESGLPMIILPNVDVPTRLDIIEQALAS